MPMLRQFSIVIHDVPSGSKSLVQAALHKLAKKYVIALEQYNHQEGYHLHLFYYLKSPSTILAQVRKWEAFKWGRVQADPMRGSFDQASVYVISADKVKHQDPSPIIFPPISDQDGRFCDCGYTAHMRYSIASYQKLMSGERDLKHETFQDALQARLDDWYTACICKTHKKFSRHANDIFPQEIKTLSNNNHGGTRIQEKDDCEEVCEEELSEEDEWYGGGASEAEASGRETDARGD
jgi:hypothetical protein